MKKLILVLIALSIFSCQKKVEKKADENACAKEKKFDMYQMSEMAALMERMYTHNLQLKNRIIKGDTIGKFPEFFNKIYTSTFTKPEDNDDFFQENAKKYIAAQKLIYSDTVNVKENFNKGVEACIACHQGKCGGPIPRIKKLFIK